MTREEAQAIWDGAIKKAADAWRGKNILDPSGASMTFTMQMWKVFAEMGDEVKTALDPDDNRWLQREFNRAVEAAL